MDKLGICEWVTPFHGESAIEFAINSGFNGIQLGDVNSIDEAYYYKKSVQNHSLIIHSVHPYRIQREGLLLFPLSSEEGQVACKTIKNMIDCCVILGTQRLMISSFFNSLIKNKTDLEVFSEHLRLYSSYANQLGIRIVFESVLSVSVLLELISFIGNGFMVCYDIVNPLKYKSGIPSDEIPLLKNYIDHFHFKDFDDGFSSPKLLGQGDCGILNIFELLNSIDFDGWIISENNYVKIAGDGSFDVLECAKTDSAFMRDHFLNFNCKPNC